jgi:hypothetical protein
LLDILAHSSSHGRELKKKILDYAGKAYYAAHQKSLQETTVKIANAKAQFSTRGALFSSDMVREAARIEAEHISTCILAKTNALLDGYELNETEVDDFIKVQANELHWELVTTITRDPHLLPPRTPDGDILERLLVTFTNGIVEEAECVIEQRKVNPKMRKPQPPVQNTYHLHGHNSRVNIDSKDQSVNVVNISNTKLFVQMRELFQKNTTGTEQERILQKLDAMEKAQNQPSFGQRYTEFIAETADYVTLLTPFMPALAEMVRKVIGG